MIAVAIPTTRKAVRTPHFSSSRENPVTKKALEKGAPMVAHPRAIPFFLGNQAAIKAGQAIVPNPAAKKQIKINTAT